MSEAIPAYSSRGDGEPTVFLLHGIGGGKEYWTLQLDVLARAGYRAIAWDMPGYGQSSIGRAVHLLGACHVRWSG